MSMSPFSTKNKRKYVNRIHQQKFIVVLTILMLVYSSNFSICDAKVSM